MTTGEIIKKHRKKMGMSQEELGNRVGVNKAAVQKWESGAVQNIKRSTLKQLSELFNISPTELLAFGKEPSPAAPELASDVRDLVTAYDRLNPNGKTKVKDYLEDLVGNPKYTAAPDSSGADNTNIGSDIADTITKIAAAQTAAKQK